MNQNNQNKMGSTSERLPSFKAPRDLSLSSRGSKAPAPSQPTSAGQPRPKRVFTPNIPPKRDKGDPPSRSTSKPSTSTAAPKDTTGTSGSSRGRSQRGRDGSRGRGGAGGRGGKRSELRQSESIFSDGIGDPAEARRASAQQYRSGYEGGRYRSAASEGRARMSNLNRNTLNTLIKEENDESDKKIFGTEKFEPEEEEETNPENPNVPVVLPLLGYVPDLFAEPSTIPMPIVTQPQPSVVLATPTLTSVSLMQIKQEKLDEDEIPPPRPTTTLVQIKQEAFDEFESRADVQRKLLAALTLGPTSFAGTFRNNSTNGTLAFFQFPDELPILKGSVRESVDQPSLADRKTSAELVEDIDDLPEGFIGRFQILSTGRTRFILGENSFDVDPGRPVGFLQELLAVDTERKTITNLGPVDRKFVITPDIESIITETL